MDLSEQKPLLPEHSLHLLPNCLIMLSCSSPRYLTTELNTAHIKANQEHNGWGYEYTGNHLIISIVLESRILFYLTSG